MQRYEDKELKLDETAVSDLLFASGLTSHSQSRSHSTNQCCPWKHYDIGPHLNPAEWRLTTAGFHEMVQFFHLDFSALTELQSNILVFLYEPEIPCNFIGSSVTLISSDPTPSWPMSFNPVTKTSPCSVRKRLWLSPKAMSLILILVKRSKVVMLIFSQNPFQR